ncbi:stromelysin-1-like [Polyergus mexicanus]|uniref:stromelysin-1-like n=1 Tax=Polyergus mexicanus TaxID=615972 RepID=UPI0038B69430
MLVATTVAAPFDSERIEALRFLRVYGFLKDDGESLSSDNATSLRRALSLFQEYYQLSGNGALNAVTLHLMRKPRCGLADIPDRAYSPIARKWPKTRLAWNFQMASEEISRTAETAFALWAANSSLTFARDPLHPDILISYRTGAHTYANRRNVGICPAAFDGPGGALAHAFFPSGTTDFTSEIHVDDSEPWHVYLNKNSPDTHHLLQTLTHEIGHALGLQHSMRNDSIMFPYIPDIENQFPVKLSIEDILAIQNLYGSHDDGNYPTATPATTAPPATTSVAPTDPARADLCALRRVDAALIINHRLYIANRRNIWSVDMTEKRYGRPMTLTDYATFLPANFTLAEIDECHMIVIRHAPLKDIFPGIPSAITSAFRYIDGNLYFCAKCQFYAFNEFTNTVTSADPFDLHALGIECPTDGLLRQLRDLLSRVYRLSDTIEKEKIDDEND